MPERGPGDRAARPKDERGTSGVRVRAGGVPRGERDVERLVERAGPETIAPRSGGSPRELHGGERHGGHGGEAESEEAEREHRDGRLERGGGGRKGSGWGRKRKAGMAGDNEARGTRLYTWLWHGPSKIPARGG